MKLILNNKSSTVTIVTEERNLELHSAEAMVYIIMKGLANKQELMTGLYEARNRDHNILEFGDQGKFMWSGKV